MLRTILRWLLLPRRERENRRHDRRMMVLAVLGLVVAVLAIVFDPLFGDWLDRRRESYSIPTFGVGEAEAPPGTSAPASNDSRVIQGPTDHQLVAPFVNNTGESRIVEEITLLSYVNTETDKRCLADAYQERFVVKDLQASRSDVKRGDSRNGGV